MRVLIQRVSEASVEAGGRITGHIEKGLLLFLGIESSDTEEDIIWLVKKVIALRIFNDQNGVMNLSVREIEGDILVVSQFTLHASTRKGNRPSYIRAAPPALAIDLYKNFINILGNEFGKPVQTGEFGAMMDVKLVNDGPVTIMIDSRSKE